MGVNEYQWVVAALVTNNDYSNHLRGQSFKKNLNELKVCEAEDSAEVLAEYCTAMNVNDPTIFQFSRDIFLEMREDLAEETRNNSGIDLKMYDLVKIVSTYLIQ